MGRIINIKESKIPHLARGLLNSTRKMDWIIKSPAQ